MKKRKVYDISPVLSVQTAVFPGDTAFSRKEELSFAKGDHFALSSITSTVHIGAHTDAPNHYHPKGAGIDQRDLDFYLGTCQVITVELPRGKRIAPNDIEVEIKAQRILFKTNSFPDPNHWNHDFNSLSPELIEMLAKKQVKLVGLDTPSVDPADAKELISHHAIYKNDMAILEGIILNQVNDGLYTLIALPLKIKDGDASPVRAILLEGELS